jgi:hypothetical protein
MADNNRKLTAERVLELAPGASLSEIAEMLARNTSTPAYNEENPPVANEPDVPTGAAQEFSVSERSPPDAQSSEGFDRQSKLKTAGELARMIEFDLSRHPDCPEVGFRVTVYGWPRWRAMLTITPAAGRVRNPQAWRDLTDELADQLRERYDLV